MRYERRTWKMESLATGIVLVSALATPFGVGSIRASGGVRSARTVVDAVDLVVRSPALPATTFVASRPGDVLQGAADVTQVPYRGLTIYAYPFGSAAPAPDSGIVEPGSLSEYRAMGTGRLIRNVRPEALLFGRRVDGSARIVDVALGPRRQPTEVVSWLTDAGDRLWVIQAAEPLRSSRNSEVAFAAGTSVASDNLSTPTTMPSSDLIRPGPALPTSQDVIVLSAGTTDPPAVRFPPWWNGNCDANNDPGSFPLSSWDGLTACGPGPNRGGWDRTVAFFPHAWGEYEWECVELSMRWLYLEYGVRPYPANGSEVVANYSRADGGDLQKIANGGSSAPVPGDVLSMEATWQEGHTAVVTATNVTGGNGTIDILEQNMDGGNGTNTLNVVDNVVEPDYGMPVTGWLQGPVSSGSSATPAADLVDEGGFDHRDGRGWQTSHARLGIEAAGKLVIGPYSGNSFGSGRTSVLGGGIYQDIPFPVRDGDSFCADAEAVTAAARPGARGVMALELLGLSPGEGSSIAFGPLPDDNAWSHVSVCVTASRPHSEIRIQFTDATRAPRLGIDAVDVHESLTLVENGGFDDGGWRAAGPSQFDRDLARRPVTRPYEANGLVLTSAPARGGDIYQDVSLPTRAGDSFCADAEVVTAAAHPGGRGRMTLWLRGESPSQSSSVRFGPLPDNNRWTHLSTCVTADRAHSEVRIQFDEAAGTPRLGIGAVDVHQSFVENGNFSRHQGNDWRAAGHTRFAIEPVGRLVTSPYEGTSFGVISVSGVGGGIYQDIALTTGARESVCADAEVVTAGARSGARGQMTIWLYGGAPTQSSSVSFGPLRGRNQWTNVSTCVTAARPHSEVRVQFYGTPRTPRLGVDAVDLR